MKEYMKRHEAFVRDRLASAGGVADWPALACHHRTQIGYMQHERLVHLLVTLFFGLCALLVSLYFFLHPQHVLAGVLLLLIIALLIPYLVHYFVLENGVQRWYTLANEIDRRAGGIAHHHDDGATAPRAR